jgi:ribosomal protein S27E
MESNVFIGHHCPKCGTTIATYASIDGAASCPGCGGPLVVASGGPRTIVIANAKCKKCGFSAGLFSCVGGEAKCPQCGGPIS